MNIRKFRLLFSVFLASADAVGQNVTVLREFQVGSRPAAVAVDGSSIYSLRRTNYPPNELVSLLKHDTRGSEIWARSFLSSPSTYVGGVTATPHGVYAVGTRILGPNSSDWDIFVARFTAAGALSWTKQISLPGRDYARGVAADSNAIYVIGQRDREGIIRKYDPSGVELWTVELDAPGEGYHAPLGISVDATGVYVAGVLQPEQQGTVGFVRKYDVNGAQIWDRHVGAIMRGVVVANNGVYAVGWMSDGVPPSSNFVRKFGIDGTELWTRHLVRDLDPAITTDISIGGDSEAIYVAGGSHRAVDGNCSQGARDAVLLKLDTEGKNIWIRQFGTSDIDYAWTIALDRSGVYVAGDRALVRVDKAAQLSDGSKPRITPGCVVNAASHLGGGVAPGQIVTIFGFGIGPTAMASQRVSEGRLSTDLAETRILFNGVPAPLLYVSERQSSAIVPYGVLAPSSVDVQVEYRGARSDVAKVQVVPARPGIFTTDGRRAVAVNEDGSTNSVSNPAATGSVITLFATGEGLTTPRVPDGTILGNTLPRPVSEVLVYFSVSEDEWPVVGEVLSIGGVPGAVAGLLHVRVRLPRDIPETQALPVSLGVRVGDVPIGSQHVTIAVR